MKRGTEDPLEQPWLDVRGASAWAVRRLTQAKVDSPQLTSELLLGHVLGWDRVRVIAFGETPLSGAQKAHYEDLVLRRARSEPLQYILEKQEFYGRSFRVTPAVMIPRPETELLVEKAISLSASRGSAGSLRFLDVGTGSGCIAISMAKELPGCEVWAVDISEEALGIARSNAERHQLLGQIRLIRSDLLDCFPLAPLFDGILSNPPYGAERDKESFEPIVRDNEPHEALFGGVSGMQVFEKLIPQAASRLKPEGFLLLEIGIGQSNSVARVVERAGLFLEAILDDLQGIPRCVVAHKRSGKSNR